MPSAAGAAFPGATGRIVENRYSEIATTFLDGGGFQYLTNTSDPNKQPAWSPDGKQIAFARKCGFCSTNGNWEIWVMDADGANARIVVDSDVVNQATDPSWSRDGSRIAFVSGFEIDGRRIYRADAGGRNQNVTQISPGSLDSFDPAYAPNSNKIAFSRFHNNPVGWDIYTINDDGTGLTLVASEPSKEQTQPSWSPDGAKLAYARGPVPRGFHDIYTINADGTGSTPVVVSAADEQGPAWAPEGNLIGFSQLSEDQLHHDIWTVTPGKGRSVVSPTDGPEQEPDFQPLLSAHVRPRGATPVFLSLVPAFKECTGGNAQHDPPFNVGAGTACVPALPVSPDLTVGEPQVNGQAANFIGWIRFKALAANQEIKVSATDVRCAGTYATTCLGGPLSDYSGNLVLAEDYRLTDRSVPAGTAGTTDDFNLALAVPCTATSDTTVGSSCSLTTTINSVVGPTAIVLGRRMIWRVLDAELRDPSGNEFAVPGTFHP